ncbi:MAG: hypothetical protein ACI9LY_000432 [Arenicella sp.]
MIKLRQARIKPACVIFVLLCSTASHAQQFACEDLLDFQAEFDGKLPMQVDGFASLLELNIDCQNNIIEYVKRLKIDESQLARGFRSRKQAQYRELHCEDDGVANHGWTSVDKIYDKNDKPLVQLTATPEMCALVSLKR